ncbi:MAG: response regulator [Bacteroidales bacterium]|jgi:signal transduction histidine kinase
MSKKVKTSDNVTDIMIVEDSATQAAQIKYLLESHHYKVEVTKDGIQALIWLSEHKPSLVISDIVMPEMNGFELCEKIKSDKRTEDIPVILLTSLSDPDEVIEGLSCGADSFITKPYNKEYLISNVEKLLTEKVIPESKKDTIGIEISYDGKKRLIRTGQQKVIKFLLNIYQGAIHQNNELIQTRDELRLLNEKLEDLVEERTKELKKDEEKILAFNAELENRILERTAQLDAANKELEAFAYSVSHDLRAPLRAVDGFSKFVLEDYEDKLDSEGKRLLNLIRSNIQKMDQLITDLLALSRVTRCELNFSVIDMTQMTTSMFKESAAPDNTDKIRLTVDPLPEAYADPTYMRQVWANLIANSIKFSSKEKKPSIKICGYTEDGFNVYYIKDNGVGFNPEYAHKLFGVFQRLHKSDDFEGTGVGLAIVQRIIHRHGGKVWAKSEEGKGATFWFSLPVKK